MRFVTLLGLWLWASIAPAATPVHVVEIANFSCPYCLAMESAGNELRRATEATGGRFVFAPISPQEGASNWQDRIYYAARNQGPKAEAAVRAALFRGAQDLNLPMENLDQVLVFLAEDLSSLELDWVRLRQDALNPSTLESYQRALWLGASAGIDAVPAYIFIVDGEIVDAIGRNPTTNDLSALRREVLDEIKKLSGK